MQRNLLVAAALVGAAAATACASTPGVNARLQTAERALLRADSDPSTHDLGRASLQDASSQLASAREAWRRNDDAAFTHEIRMAETNIELAEARGDQGEAESAIAAIEQRRSELRISLRDDAVVRAEARRDRAEQELDAVRSELNDYQMRETSLGMVLVLQDLQFATDSSALRDGAKARLDPLASYLMRNEAAHIRVAGHTDSVGGSDYNRELSQRRAGAVAAYLVSRGVDASHIEAVGMGETSPVGSNDTTSGREENRRVEVTILRT